MGDPIFDAYYASTVPSVADQVVQESAVQKAGAQLLDVIGKPVIVIAHSQGGPVSWGIADARAQLVRSFVAIEPAGPPFRDAAFGNADPARAYGLTNIPITYSPAVTDPEGFCAGDDSGERDGAAGLSRSGGGSGSATVG